MARFAGSRGFQDAYNAVSELGVDFNKLGTAGQASRARQNMTAMDSVAKLHDAENQAEVIEAAGALAASQTQSQGNQALFGGIMDGATGLAGAIPMGGGGGGGGFAPTLKFDSRSAIPASVYTTGY